MKTLGMLATDSQRSRTKIALELVECGEAYSTGKEPVISAYSRCRLTGMSTALDEPSGLWMAGETSNDNFLLPAAHGQSCTKLRVGRRHLPSFGG